MNGSRQVKKWDFAYKARNKLYKFLQSLDTKHQSQSWYVKLCVITCSD